MIDLSLFSFSVLKRLMRRASSLSQKNILRRCCPLNSPNDLAPFEFTLSWLYRGGFYQNSSGFIVITACQNTNNLKPSKNFKILKFLWHCEWSKRRQFKYYFRIMWMFRYIYNKNYLLFSMSLKIGMSFQMLNVRSFFLCFLRLSIFIFFHFRS